MLQRRSPMGPDPVSGARLTDVLQRFLLDRLPTACVGAVRPVRAHDELLLTAVEADALKRAVVGVRRASGAGRDLARGLCRQLNMEVVDIPRSPDGAPVWPPGVVGSISHDRSFVAAIVGLTSHVSGIGIDIEPPESLPRNLDRVIASDDERWAFRRQPCGSRVLFSIKEAVFKAVYPRDRVFLDFGEVTVDSGTGTATTRYGRAVHWYAVADPHILAVAWY